MNKETEQPVKIEIGTEKEQLEKTKLIGRITPHEGHKLYELNLDTGKIDLAEYEKETEIVFETLEQFREYKAPNRKVIIKEGCVYISALNMKNAVKKLRKGSNGSKH